MDTERALADLIALTPDNTAGLVSNQDLRDMLVSMLGGYASVSVEDGAAAQVVNIAAAQLIAFTINGPSSGCIPDHTDDSIQLNTAGKYLVTGTFSLLGTAARIVQLRARLQGLEVLGMGGRCKFNASGEVTTIAFSGIVTAAAGDHLTVYVEADVDATSITVVDANLSAKRIG